MQANYYAKQIAKRFHLPATPTLVSGIAGVSPILASRLRCESTGLGTAEPPPRVDAYELHVAIQAVDSMELRLLGRLATSDPVPRGGIVLVNMESSPVPTFHSPFDLVRFEVSQVAINAMSNAFDEKSISELKRPPFGHEDLVLFHMASALLPSFARIDRMDSLFMDQIALALHSHLTSTYGGSCVDPRPLRSGLASWQIGRATQMIEANMSPDLGIVDLARECRLSPKHFARAFRRTFGVPPYQWLQERRVDRAKKLLRENEMPLLSIAESCGFTSQSHFTRVFTTIVGASPGAWRRYMNYRTHVLIGPRQAKPVVAMHILERSSP